MKKMLLVFAFGFLLAGLGASLAYANAQSNACNGATCTVNGTTLNCPSSGGPTCATGESCVCTCKDLGQHNYTAYNECKKKKTTNAEVMSEAISEISEY